MWNTISAIAAFVGCITGSISLYIVLTQNSFQKGKTVIEKLDYKYKLFYYNPKDYNLDKNYNTSCSAEISLKITNQSAYPLTIDDIYIDALNQKISHYKEFGVNQLYSEVLNSDNMSYLFVDFAEASSFPQKFDPFESKYIGLRFPFFHIDKQNSNNQRIIKLAVLTSRGKIDYSLEVNNLEEYFRDFNKGAENIDKFKV